MKIACQACQAKYTIADEKVLGKIVKIRCKKCGATIVINGNEGEAAAAPQAGGQAYDYAQQGGGAEPWTVNVADGDQRTMSTQEIIAAFQSGVVNEETFCWKDGMSDWLPLRDVPEIYGAVAGGGHPMPPAPAQDDEATAVAAAGQPGFSSLFGGGGGGSNGGAALFGSEAAAAPAPQAARRAGRTGGADLFGGAAAAGGEDDVMTSAAAGAPTGGEQKTGERNENSVLFSLSALTETAPKEEKKTTATTEGSGLIDIRALSASMAKEEAGPKKGVDDIMHLGGGGAFAPALAAPVLAPPPDVADLQPGEKKKGNAGMMIVLILGALVIIGGAVGLALFFALKPKEGTGPVASNTVTAPTTTETSTAPTGTTATNDTAGTSTATAPGTGASTNTAKPPGTGGGTVKPPTTGGGNTVAANTSTATIPTSTGASGGGCCPGESEMQCNMRKSAGQPCPAATANTGGGGGSAPFDRGAASGALGAVNLSSCKKPDGPTGAGHVKVTFATNGTVSAVEVDQPPFAGTSVGGCIAGKFRGAKIPAFSGSPVTVGKSFSLN